MSALRARLVGVLIKWTHPPSDYNNIGKFLNRILGMAVQQQNALFQYFSDTLAAVIQEAKKNGRFDLGILGKMSVPFPFPYTLMTQLS